MNVICDRADSCEKRMGHRGACYPHHLRFDRCGAQQPDLRLGPRVPTCDLPAGHAWPWHRDGDFTWSVR